MKKYIYEKEIESFWMDMRHHGRFCRVRGKGHPFITVAA
jgi:hypothetical protein